MEREHGLRGTMWPLGLESEFQLVSQSVLGNINKPLGQILKETLVIFDNVFRWFDCIFIFDDVYFTFTL